MLFGSFPAWLPTLPRHAAERVILSLLAGLETYTGNPANRMVTRHQGNGSPQAFYLSHALENIGVIESHPSG
jgi:hypothetical protein